MLIVVVAMDVDGLNSLHVILSVPLKLSVTGLISSVDIRGVSFIPDILVTIIREVFIITLRVPTVVDEMVMSVGPLIPFKVSLHCRALSVVLHVNSSLFPALHAYISSWGGRQYYSTYK